MKSKSRRFLALGNLQGVLLICCATTNADSSAKVRNIIENGQVAEVVAKVVEDKEGDPSNDYCRGFMLNSEQIKEFFKRAEALTTEEENLLYDWSPCHIEGKFVINKKYYTFMINAASTGVVFLSENESINYGCKKACKDIFDYGF